jgi:sugar phosphate isomerase/epimerase
MILDHGLHLAYCTNVHPGEDWAQTFRSLNHYTLAVKKSLGTDEPYAIGLRLSDLASRELADPARLLEFRRWLDNHNCYIFTINGFPFGRFHSTRVKEEVYRPDWTDPRRLDYTIRLFDLLAQLLPPDVEGSVSTSPGSFKEFIQSPEQERRIRDNLWRCVEHIAEVSQRIGHRLHLGVEPEPLGLFENSRETARFFDQLRDEHPHDDRLDEHLGVNYDTCHFAVEFEEPKTAVARLREHGIRLSKIHISNALKLSPTPEALARLAAFTDDVYLHQVIVRDQNGALTRFKDLDVALARPLAHDASAAEEWRVHFHIPLHSRPPVEFATTADHILGLLKLFGAQPQLCSHLEMETYTWAVLPEPLKTREVADQIVGEYRWTLKHLAELGLARSNHGNPT